MKAVRIHEYRTPPSLDEIPQPDLHGHHDVIVRIGGAGVCRTDLHVVDGWFENIMRPERPFTLGHENAGWVEAVGDAVTSVHVGDPVIVHPLATCGVCGACRQGEDMYCTASTFPGVTVDGGYAEYLCTSERSLVLLPPGVEPAQVAPHADAGITAYRAVRKVSEVLQPGQTAVVIGVGGLGHIGLQLLSEMTPARIVAVDKSQLGRDLASKVGAEAIFGTEDAIDGVAELTGGLGADVVIDFVAEHDTPDRALRMLRQGGTYSIVGYGADLHIPTVEMVLKEITVLGNLVGNYADLDGLMKLVVNGRVQLETRDYPLDAAAQALDDLENGRIQGRAVLTPA
ncbi:alcohol dehydrogenase catalytic domain-containing protein [Pseudonocardia acidicola]|uniref:alcohol dehydrogenase n=1 Tax=Pseudonocardia acidicola TaxID=2724939 RepID=A0ABX1SLD1_9PSEU|nr:NAD(P)-dependent alcohol dehydrogenase [Pseudonocardia acidicola]